MLKSSSLIILFLSAVFYSCAGQNSKKIKDKMKNDITSNNPLMCDPVEGICGIPGSSAKPAATTQNTDKPVKVIYFTDPICSSCWGIEPQLRKLKLEYGNDIEIEYHMGGLLPDWSYSGGGISSPSDVAHHWDAASHNYDMPIDGDIWLEDPLNSSYPPSIAYKAAELQSDKKAGTFLRELREMVFLKKKNIAKWENIAEAAKAADLNINQLKADFDGLAPALFNEDLKLAKKFGVRGFPTFIFVNSSGEQEIIYGSKPYPFFETALLQMNPQTKKTEYKKDWESLFSIYGSMTAKEFSELSGTDRSESELILNKISSDDKLEKFSTKNGSIWTYKHN